MKYCRFMAINYKTPRTTIYLKGEKVDIESFKTQVDGYLKKDFDIELNSLYSTKKGEKK